MPSQQAAGQGGHRLECVEAPRCGFCGRSQHETRRLVRGTPQAGGPASHICDRCALSVAEAVAAPADFPLREVPGFKESLRRIADAQAEEPAGAPARNADAPAG